MHELPPKHLPIVIILRASGWRIGDVLNLRYDTCLEHTSSGWWLCGDILKTEVLNHKVPISDEIASIVAGQCEIVKEQYSDREILIGISSHLHTSEGKVVLCIMDTSKTCSIDSLRLAKSREKMEAFFISRIMPFAIRRQLS